MKEHFETVIIGGGVSGLSCARRLHAGSRSFVVVTDRLGGRMYHSADGEMNYGATYINADYENMAQFVGRGMPFRLHEVYTENNGKLTTFFDLRNARDALPFARLALRLQELRRTLRRFRKEAEHVSAAELLPRFPLMERYANQSSAELIRDLGLERLDQRYFRSSFFATCFADPALSNALFYLGSLFPLVTSTWVGDFTHTYDRLTEGFADQIEIDKVTSLDRTDGGGWAVQMAGGATYLAKNVVLGIPYHNAEKLSDRSARSWRAPPKVQRQTLNAVSSRDVRSRLDLAASNGLRPIVLHASGTGSVFILPGPRGAEDRNLENRSGHLKCELAPPQLRAKPLSRRRL